MTQATIRNLGGSSGTQNFSTGRRIVSLNNGTLFVVTRWGSLMTLSKSTDGGATWVDCQTVSLSGFTGAALATDGVNYVYMIHNSVNNMHFRLYNSDGVFQSSVSSIGGGTFNLASCKGFVRGSDGVLHVAFDAGLSNIQTAYTKSTDNGQTWSAYQLIGQQLANVERYSCGLGLINNIPIVVLTRKQVSSYKVVPYILQGGTWIEKIDNLINAVNDGDTFEPSFSHVYVKRFGSYIGRIFALWQMKTTTEPDFTNILYSYSDDNGTSWVTTMKMTTPVSSTRAFASVGENTNGDLFVFYSNGDTPNKIYYQKCANGANSFSGATYIADGSFPSAIETTTIGGFMASFFVFGSNALYNYFDGSTPTGSRTDDQSRYLNAGANKTITFTVNVSDNVGVTSVKFPTWGNSSGQNDIVWYEGTNNGNGTWSRTINFNDHDSGIDQQYFVHVYGYDAMGNNAMITSYDVYIDTVVPSSPTQTNGILYASSNGVSWTAFNDGANSSGLLLTIINFQSWNGSTWNNVVNYPKSVTGITHSFTGLTPNTLYRWGVTYTDNSSNVSTLNYTTFITNSYAVSTIVNLTSSGYTFNQRPKIKFTVTDSNNATLTNFEVMFATDEAFTLNVGGNTSSVAPTQFSATSASSGSTIYFAPTSDRATGLWYVRARAYDGIEWGTWSTTVSFTIQTASYPTVIASDDTAISKRTIDDIRTKVNSARQARGLAVATWTDDTIVDWNGVTPTSIRISHIIELRQAIIDIYTALSITNPTWTDNIISTSIDRKGIHWTELRNALLGC